MKKAHLLIHGANGIYVRRILITGASGYLGQHLLFSFLSNPPDDDTSYHIHALYHRAEGFLEALQSIPCANNVFVIVKSLDLTNRDEVEAWLQEHTNLDVCIHTAAISSPKLCQENPDLARACNIPKNFFEALRKHSIRIIALSTDQVYDGTAPPYKETDATGPCNLYGQSKLEMETYLQSIDPSVVLLRSSIMLGPKAPILPDGAHGTFLHFCSSRQGMDTEFYTDEKRNVVAVKDVVACIRWFVAYPQLPCEGIYNLGGPESVSRWDMAQAVFAHIDYDTKHLIAKTKADLPQGPVPSPLDISMDSQKLAALTGFQFQGLSDMVQTTFA